MQNMVPTVRQAGAQRGRLQAEAARKQKRRRRRRRVRLVLLLAALCALLFVLMRAFSDTSCFFPALQAMQQVSGAAQPETDGWQLLLVNGSNPVPDGYTPPLRKLSGGSYQFDTRAADALEDMLADARSAGLSPLICSAYRTNDYQRGLYEKQVAKQKQAGLSDEAAREKAKTVVAYPGTSEHEIGLAVDLVASSYQLLDDAQADTAEAKWFKAHCAEYGFILRYPPDKSDVTGVIFEPWHYRYVGREAAEAIMSQGITLEEYLGA